MLTLPALRPFDDSDWDAIAAAFKDAPVLATRQTWLPALEEKFRPAFVQVGWLEDAFHVYARMEDDDVYSDATEDQQMVYMIGDVLEIFLQDMDRPEYVELHTAPTGHRLQLRFHNENSIVEVRGKQRKLAEFLVENTGFVSCVRMVPGGWEMASKVPYRMVNPEASSPAGRRVRLSFGRYDRTRGVKEPVVSATAAFKELNFHRLSDWDIMQFEG